MDESSIVPFFAFNEIDETFSAFQKKENKDETDSGNNTTSGGTGARLERSNSNPNKPKELAFIDNNRSRNCEIILKKINMSNEELRSIIITMDEEEKLSKDMVEQMLKIVPEAEDTKLFEPHIDDVDLFARPDRFLYEMSKIPRFEQRLNSLFYKKGFQERVGEIKPKMECLMRACRQVMRSKRLRTLLEVILVLGNYMNKGSRGNASGFKLQSLNKMLDTKSSVDRRITLLHYVLEFLMGKFPTVFKLEEDLTDIRNASKINPVELNSELVALRKGINSLEDELNYQNSVKISQRLPNDRFVDIVGNFIKVSKFSIQENEDLSEEMKEKLKKALSFYGEDSKSVSSDEFFGLLNDFLVSFAEAKTENEAMKKQKEEEERKQRSLAEQNEKDKQRKMSKKLVLDTQAANDEKRHSLSERSPGEFDDLISALRTGDVFGDEISLKRSKRGGPGGKGRSTGTKMSVIGERDRHIDSKQIALSIQ